MSVGTSEPVESSPFVARVELALATLKDHVASHISRESQFRRIYGEWHQNLLARADQLRHEIAELEARLAPWMPRGESLRLAVVRQPEENS